MTFDELHHSVAEWAQQQCDHIGKVGRPLTDTEMTVARAVGVKHPEKIRVLIVPSIPFPEAPAILEVGKKVGLVSENTGGLTLGYGIYIRTDEVNSATIWPHEFRHVAQFECLGSHHNSTFVYLKELLHFGYGKGPMEIDAQRAENVSPKKNSGCPIEQ